MAAHAETAGELALVEVRPPATAVHGDAVGELVDLGDVGDHVIEEAPIVAHEQGGGVDADHPPFEPVETVEIEVTLGERDTEGGSETDRTPGEDEEDTVSERVGVSVTTLDDRTRQMYRIRGSIEGLLITRVRADSPAGDEGLARGDVILEINGRSAAKMRSYSVMA